MKSMLLLCLISAIQAYGQAAPEVDPLVPIVIPPGLTSLEEPSLVPDARLAVLTGANNGWEIRKELNPATGDYFSVGMSETDMESTNGFCVYGFLLTPGETLNLKLQAEGARIMMRVIKPATVDPMSGAILRANTPPTTLRRSRLRIQNVTKRPYMVKLLLYGAANHRYRLDIQRG